jgi:hypothetical protein
MNSQYLLLLVRIPPIVDRMTAESRFDVSESSNVTAEQRNNEVGPSMSRKGDCTFLGILGRHGEESVVVVLALEKNREEGSRNSFSKIKVLCVVQAWHVTIPELVILRSLKISHQEKLQHVLNATIWSTRRSVPG